MAPIRRALDSAFATVILDGSGNGIASLGPSRPRERWYPAIVAVSVSSNVNEPTCKIYMGPQISAATFVDGTYTGSNDSTDSGNGSEVHVGEQVFAQWTGGDAGATATVTVTGELQIGI